jgi:hypothetical protein
MLNDMVWLFTLSFSRVDFDGKDLIVGCDVGFGHEIMATLFDDLRHNDTSYPLWYNNTRIRTCSQATVELAEGSKSPDFALIEVDKEEDEAEESGNEEEDEGLVPTIAWEIGYSESEEKLQMDAARLLCLTEGLVRLVVTVKITHEPNTSPRKLKRVVWRHWELDPTHFRRVDNSVKGLNKPKPLPPDNRTSPPPYEAYVKFDKEVYRLVAHVTDSYEV